MRRGRSWRILSVDVVVGSDIEEDDRARFECKDEAVLSRNPDGEVVREISMKAVFAQGRRTRVFRDELHRCTYLARELRAAGEEIRKSFFKPWEDKPHATLSLRRRSATDLWTS